MKASFTAMLTGVLVLAGLSAPSASAKAGSCPRFKPAVAGAQDAKVIQVTDKASENKPLEISFEHPQALPLPAPAPITEDTVYYNVQIATAQPSIGLFILQEFN